MELVSVNIGKQEILDTPNGLVQTGIIKNPVHSPVTITKLGIQGDAIVDTKVHGGTDQALYLYSQKDYDWWEKQLGRSLAPGLFGENLTLSDFGDAPFKIGDRLQINAVVIEISAPRTPCFKLATRMGDPGFIKAFVQAARTGAYARVIQTGEIAAGDKVRLISTSSHPSVTEVFNACHTKNPDMDIVKKAMHAPLGFHHKKIIQSIYDKNPR